MGLGKSVGAVSCAVDYLEKSLELASNDKSITFFSGSGGINHKEENIGKIEAIVIFTSKEVIENNIIAFPFNGVEKPKGVREELVTQLRKIWKTQPNLGRKIFWCDVDIDDFNDCFTKIVKVAYRFSPWGKTGKEIWCNLTGGANAINIALLSMARLTGLSTRLYLLSQKKEYQKEIQVPFSVNVIPGKDKYFITIPYIKTRIDDYNFYIILEELNTVGSSIKTSDLFARIKSKPQFQSLDIETFIRQYLLKLYGLNYTLYNKDQGEVALSSDGKYFLDYELERLYSIISLENEINQGTLNIVDESKQWTWLTEFNLDNP